MHVEHQRLVRPGLFGGDAGEDAVQLGMAVQLRVLRHRQAAHVRDGGEADRARQFRARMFHDDRDGRPLLAEARMLEGPRLDPARDHQAGMGVGGHAVGVLRVDDGLFHLIGGHADVEVDGLRRLEQAVDMLVEEGPAAVVEPDPLPHPVAQHEAGVIDADQRLRLGHDPAVHVDQDRLVAGVLLGLVGADMVGHGVLRFPARLDGAGGRAKGDRSPMRASRGGEWTASARLPASSASKWRRQR